MKRTVQMHSGINNSSPPIDSEKKLLGIRIARISTVPFFVVTQLKQQISVIGENGSEVTIITSVGPELALLDGLVGVKCVPIIIPRSISPWADLVALFRLYIFFRRQHTQIAHSTTPKAGLLTALAAFFARVPLRLHTFTGQPWVDMKGPKRWLTRTSDRFIGLLNTRCYTDSASQKQFLIEQGIMDANRLFCIGAGSLAGVDVQRFDLGRFSQSQRNSIRESLGISAEAPVLLFVGRITVEKGVWELIKAFQLLRATDSNAHLVLVGPLDTESGAGETILLKQINRLFNVHIIGYTDSPETYISISDILCLPSYREGFGTVVIEAAAMGVPTVGTEIYGLSDAIVHGVTGLLVPPRNVEELANALIKLSTDKLFTKRLGEAARQRALDLFDSRKVNAQMVNEYRILIEEKRMLK
jgi:glycosyltransferase involved in cell wall biosynthesis